LTNGAAETILPASADTNGATWNARQKPGRQDPSTFCWPEKIKPMRHKLTRGQQIKGCRKALANPKTPKQFLPGLKKRLKKLGG